MYGGVVHSIYAHLDGEEGAREGGRGERGGKGGERKVER
jgi:hypothetical protein